MHAVWDLLHVLLIPILFIFSVLKWIVVVIVGFWLKAFLAVIILMAIIGYLVYRMVNKSS